MAVDTACSSSLVAVHLAVRSLQGGESAMALAGGVHLLLSPEMMVASTKLGATAPDGRCKTFDASADGFGHGEGCGIVVLKRLADAEAAGDRILAVIRGTAVNQDGRSNSLTAPNGGAQQEVVRLALARAGIAPAQVGYVEAHGTGTRLGDPIEIEALSAVLGQRRQAPLMIGSVKTNLGHLEAAAGIAGLIKAVLCVEGGVVPPHLHLTTLNPEIDPAPLQLVVPRTPTPWAGIDGRRIAGVSAFGFGGTNAHVVLEAPPIAPPAAADDGRVRVLPLSAKSPAALMALAEAWAIRLDAGAAVADAALTAGAGRSHHAHRLAVTGATSAAVATALRRAQPATATRPPKIAFLFTGQGAQYPGMAQGAYRRFPVFRDALDRAAAVLDPLLPRPALDLLFGLGPIDDTALAQPLIVAVELALAALWRSWGITPAAVMGHSVGEYAAAVVAGVLTEAEALTLIAGRGRLMAGLPAGGGMLAVLASAGTVEPLLPPGLSVAAINGPANVVVSGPLADIDDLARALDARDIDHRRLVVSHGFHSHLLDPVLPALGRLAEGVDWQVPRLPIVSNLTGRPHDRYDAAYWPDHARRPVRFADGIAALRGLGCDLFLELGPQPVLTGLAADPAAFGSLRRGQADDAMLAEALARLYRAGVAIDWNAVDGGAGRRIGAPTYPFQRQPFWLDLPDRQAAMQVPATLAPASPNAALVYDFYDELTVVSRTYETTDPGAQADDVDAEAHLTFGFLPAPVPGFSWIRALFDKDSDPAGHALFRSSQRALKDALFDGIDFTHIRRVFDYGCGHAADLCSLALHHPHIRAQGFTLSAGQVEVGRRRIARLGLGDRVRVDRNDSSVAPFPGHFDLIFGFEVTGLIADKDALFDNIVAHLAPGGVVVIADFVSTGDPIANTETNSFTPSHEQWVELFTRRRLRLTRAVDASPEVANWLVDPDFAGNVDDLVARFGLGELTRRHLLSNENIGKALRQNLMRYLLLTAQAAPHETLDSLRAANDAALRRPVAYATQRPAWQRWLYRVDWQDVALPEPLPAPGALGLRLEASVARERAAIAAFGDVGADLDALARDFSIAAFRALGAQTVADIGGLAMAPPFRRLRDRLRDFLADSGVARLDDPGDVAARLAPVHQAAAAETALLAACGPHLAEVLAGRVDPLTLLFPGGDTAAANRLYETSPYSQAVQRLAAEAVAALPRRRPLRAIEIGGGTGGTTAHLLPVLPEGSDYLFTDVGGSLVNRAEARFAGAAGLRLDFATLDIARPPAGQNLAPGAFDLVVAANVLHATPDLGATLDHVAELAAPGGLLVMVENTGKLAWGDLTFGLTDGMWAFTDTALRDYALLRQDQWRDLLPRHGFEDVTILTPGTPDRGGVSQQCVILARRSARRRWHLVDAPAMLAAALVAAGDEVTGLDAATDVVLGTNAAAQVLAPKTVLRPALDLVQALAAQPAPPRLALLADDAGLPAQGTLPGFARTVAAEAPELACRLIDADAGADLAAELRQGRDSEVALRGGRRKLPRLAPLPAGRMAPIAFDPGSSWLVTGGLGGIGLRIARWLGERGVRHLVLAGRGEPGPAALDEIAALPGRGIAVTVMRADVGDRDAVAGLIAAAQGLAPLKGVIHSAGMVDDAGLLRQDWPRFERVLNAKLRGSWHLHELTAGLGLDHFVLFSSAAGLIGPSGQANHAAANSVVDAISAHRRAAGLPALAIDWGAWAEIGAAVRDGVGARVERTGLVHMAPDQALAALEWLMQADGLPAHVAVVDADWSAYRRRFARGAVPTLLAGLAAAAPRPEQAPVPQPAAPAAGWAARLEAAAEDRRRDLLADLVRGEAAKIMRLDEAELEQGRSLRDLGLDSLMSIELRNALVARIGTKLPATLLFDHPSIAALTTCLAETVFTGLFAAGPADDLAGLDADALSALLESELDEVGA